MKIFTAEQTRAWDAYTIENEPVSSLALINRAARAFASRFMEYFPDTARPICILVGQGNNGADGLAVARILHQAFYDVKVLVCNFSNHHSSDFNAQLEALPAFNSIDLQRMSADPALWPALLPKTVLIDALFGTGLSRPLDGIWAVLIDWINRQPYEVVAIDLPSGLPADGPAFGPCVEANFTIAFERPKLAFFLSENARFIGKWTVRNIHLHPAFDTSASTPWHYTTDADIRQLLHPRETFSHKGTYGHALLIAGSYGKMGAAVLAARACLRSGVGLLTVYGPSAGYDILQTTVPEAMFLNDENEKLWSTPPHLERFDALGIGPGIGTDALTAAALEQTLKNNTLPLVLDADALNLLALHPQWWTMLPEQCILTPHPKEFERLFGAAGSRAEQLEILRAKARQYKCCIVLKGAYSAFATPEGNCYFNSTGNPGMATGGTGDVLTGLLAGLLAQGYKACEAGRIGLYIHGLAGDLAAEYHSAVGLTAGDVADRIGKAFLSI